MTTHQEIEQALQQLPWNGEPHNLYAPIEYALSAGGKRIRPSLVLMAGDLYSTPHSQLIEAALGIEIFHNFTLLHDDVMDHADLRRGRPTVHKKWSENTAILSGDQMLIEAYRHISSVDEQHLPQVLQLFTAMATGICEGQQLDMDFETRSDVTIADYLTMICLKTALLLGTALQIGAVLSDAPAADGQALYRFGINVGLAFQLQDDLLDVYGNPATFGKNIGGDIVEGKKTFMLLTALERSVGVEREELLSWLDNHTEAVREKKIAAVRDLYTHLGVDKIAREAIAHYNTAALHDLQELSVNPERTLALRELLDKLINREV